jgi:trehalose synthase
MREVAVDAMDLARLGRVIDPKRADRLREYAVRTRERLHGLVVWNVNATATGGGVAEMLQTMLAYGRGAGVDLRWLVLDGDPEFFATTKRLHNFLHGSPGDGGELGEAEHKHYFDVLEENLASVVEVIRPGDIVLLHDPQTAGLVDGLRAAGALVAWRCHIGRDEPSELSAVGWEFLRTYAERADAFVFSRSQYAPSWVPEEKLWVIAPSLDPFSAKNVELTLPDVLTTLRVAGLVDTPPDGGSLEFVRRTGEPGSVRPRGSLMIDGPPVPRGARVVLQVSRWDRLKDMQGVLTGFVDHVEQMPDDAHLVLAGPDVLGVTDDPEGAEVLAECRAVRAALPEDLRRRVHLTALPMDDADENAHLVNVLQRYASVVVQKSLVEGFGLTVTEPMWKSRPVVASAVGGILDQIEDGVSGLLLEDPADLAAMARAVAAVLLDEELAARLGAEAHARVLDRFLGDRHLIQYAELFETMLTGAPAAG